MPFLDPFLRLAATSLLAAVLTAQPWPVASPESQGFDPARLEAARKELAARATKNLLVVRNGRIVCEWYGEGAGPDKPHYTASLAKAIVGGMSLLVAANDNRIRFDDPAWKYIPAWKNDPRKSKITIRHLATHSSGVEDAEQDDIPHNKLPGWKGAFWRRDPDPFTIAIHQAPVVFDPGTRYAYSNPGMAALAYAVTASLKGAPQSDLRALLKERIMDPIGVPEQEWSIGYNRAYQVDGLSLYANWGGGSYTARAIARVGELMMQRGRTEDRVLLKRPMVERVLGYANTPKPRRREGNPAPASGLGWWINYDGIWSQVPRDAFAGAGAGNQVLLVVPSLDLIIVRQGGELARKGEQATFWGAVEKHLFHPLLAALTDKEKGGVEAPYPPSPVIRGAVWAPASTIVRDAQDSDNWPLTWADDDAQYTAYGDGTGFAPKVEKKLGIGFAKVLGPPGSHKGINIRSEAAENTGFGPNGEKGSGILMVDGVLYLWVRNAANARLRWSADHGKSWQAAAWKLETSFGHPAFLNYGRNYAGARDDFVYIVSHDHDSAYEPAGRFVMARAPKDRLRERAAYEFFEKIENGQPRWTPDIGRRGAVFSFPGRAYRSQITYNAGLKRYLWCQILPGHDPRFEGGFGIYDAPEPWGPWTTVFFTRKWDVGPGENCGLPAKWMSADGRTAWLVFSGDDSFSLRKVTFQVQQ